MAPFLLLHSAGAGRSGAYILMDILFEQLHKEKRVNVSKTVYELRRRRTEMIQNLVGSIKF